MKVRFAFIAAAGLFLLAGGGRGHAQEIRRLTLPTNDIIYDPFTGRLYASVPSSAGVGRGNTITRINPYAGANPVLEASVFLGSEPGRLARTDDGQYLYAALNGAASARRFSLATQTAGLQFALGSDPFTGPFYVEEIEAMPGAPDTVAVSRRNVGFSPRHQGVAIYDNGVQRPTTTQSHTGSNRIEFGATPNRIYGYNNETTEFGFRRLTVGPNGVSEQDVTQNLISGFNVDIKYENGTVYATTGAAIDPEARVLRGTYSGVGFAASVLPDSRMGVVYFLTQSGSTVQILKYDLPTFIPIGSMSVTSVTGNAFSLLRWGNNRLVFRTDAGQIVFIGPSVPWDINGDGHTDDADLSLVLAQQGLCRGAAGFDPNTDVNHDGCVDDADLGLVLAHQGE